MQQYVDYMVLNPSRSSVHMQTPLLDPYTYHKVGGMFRQTLQNSLLKPCSNILLCMEKSPMCRTRLNQNISESNTLLFYFCVSLPPSGQSSTCLLCVCVLLQQQYGYQEEEERSLNSLDDNPALPLHPSSYRSRSRGSPLDRDRQLLQDLVSFYLTSPSSSSSSSSSPVQSLPRHRGAVAAAAGLPSSLSSSSSSSFFPELDFPLDYGEDYVSQVAQQDPAEKKAQDEYDALSELDGERGEKRRQVIISFVHRVYFLCIPF